MAHGYYCRANPRRHAPGSRCRNLLDFPLRAADASLGCENGSVLSFRHPRLLTLFSMKGQAFGSPGIQLKPADISFAIPLEDKFQTFVVRYKCVLPHGAKRQLLRTVQKTISVLNVLQH